MAKLKGVSCILDCFRGHDIENALGYSASFSDVVDSNLKIPAIGLAFVSLDGEDVHYLMLFKKSGRVATKKDRITFRKPIKLEPALPLENIQGEAPSNIKWHIINQTTKGINPLSPKVFSFLLNKIKLCYPDKLEDIEELERVIKGKSGLYYGAGAEIIAQEKDAVCLALRVAGFSDRDLPVWSSSDEPAPFLSGFESAAIREDPMVAHDAEVFGDWKRISRYVVGATEFFKDGHKLTIMNVNRHKVEETLGVDLIMYHHTYKSYVLIQYKRMHKEGSQYIYRPNDKSYKSEIKKMNQFMEIISDDGQANLGEPHSYRLNNELFYFKLCPTEPKDLFSTKMIVGMYIPLLYWKSLLGSKKTNGPKGGKLVTYDNASRHINNTLFIELMQNGWIGSRVKSSKIVSNIIQDSISRNNSVILAKYIKAK